MLFRISAAVTAVRTDVWSATCDDKRPRCGAFSHVPVAWNARRPSASGDESPRKPTNGSAACCARAASGHGAAVPPSSVMNSRRAHSITSSASNCMELGTVKPSAAAVLRLMTSSNLAACVTGKSAGFSPLENSPRVGASLRIAVDKARAVSHQPTGQRKLAPLIFVRGIAKTCSQGNNVLAPTVEERIGSHE